VVYLVIIVAIAAAGIGRLWWVQRRHTTSLSSVEGFRSSLERLAGQQPVSGPTDRSSTSNGSSELDAAETGAGAVFGRSSQVDAAGRGARSASSDRSRQDLDPWAAADGSDALSLSQQQDRGAATGSVVGSSSAFRGSQDRSASDPYLEPLDPERRAAAKRRLEARRRGASRSGLRSR
jgi:hypothetical protein